MKNLLAILIIIAAGISNSFSQTGDLSTDSLVNRMKLNSLNIKVDAQSASADEYYNRGILNAFFGDTSSAISDYSTAIKKRPSFELAYINRGAIYQKQAQFAEAETKLEGFEKAEEDFDKAIKLNKNSAIALNNRGFLYQNWGKTDAAIKDLEGAIKIDPTYAQPYMNLVDLYLNQQKTKMAFEVLDKMVNAIPSDPKVYTTRSDVYRDAGIMLIALEDLNRAVEISGNDPDYLIERAKFKDISINDDLGAVEDCELAIQKNPENADYYYQRSRPLYDLAEYTLVIEDCEKAIELDPNHTNAMVMKANVMDMYKLFDDAKKMYERAISIAPDDYDSYKQLSVSEFAQGNKMEAISVLERFMNRGKFHKDITEQHGKIAADLKQFDRSLEDFSELIRRYPRDPSYYFLRGIIQDSIGDHEAACDDMVSADKLGLNQAHQYLRKHCKSRLSAKTLQIEDMFDEIVVLQKQGKTEEAILGYSKLISIAPDSSVFYYNRGKAKRRLNNHEGAIEDYLKAIDLNGDRVSYFVSLGVSYSYLDQIDDAIKAYRKAIKIEPYYAMSYYNLGGIYAKKKKYAEAIKLFETSLDCSPNYTKAMMALGDCYLEMGENPKACEWYKKAEKAGDAKAFGKRVRTCSGD